MTTTQRKNTRKSNSGSPKNSTSNKNLKKSGKTQSKSSTTRNKNIRSKSNKDSTLKQEALVLLMLFVVVLLFLCMINVIGGAIGPLIKRMLLGLFGIIAYILPIILFFAFAFRLANKGNSIATVKLIASITFILSLGILISFVTQMDIKLLSSSKSMFKELYDVQGGGGVIFGMLACFLYKGLGNAGTILFSIIVLLISLIFITEKTFIKNLLNSDIWNRYDDEFEDDEEERKALEEERRLRHEEKMARRQEMLEKREENNRKREEKRKELEEQRITEAAELKKKKEINDDERILNASSNYQAKDDSLSLNMNIPLLEQHRIVSKDEIHEITFDYEADTNDFEEEITPVNDIKSNANEPEINIVRSSSYYSDKDNLEHMIEEQTFAYEKQIEVSPTEISQAIDMQTIASQENVSQEKVSQEKVSQENVSPKNVSRGNVSQSGTSTPNVSQLSVSQPSVSHKNNEVTHVSQLNDTQLELPESVKTFVPITPTVSDIDDMPEPVTERNHESVQGLVSKPKQKRNLNYKFPKLDLLNKNKKKNGGDSDDYLKKTAAKLKETLHIFGVDVNVTEISQGPSVTRYEMELAPGIKVSKINGLADDIQLNMAAQDIRIEAPIPGKAAVGIEIPNKEINAVYIRDLLESKEFIEAKSNISFAVGKDITGKTIVTDIGSLPHMLIAGSTGSGKSVCINTLIMSILYKANPDDVKLIMIDPKVVELSVYNGIPHLMIPVVTDPRKASAALQWAVTEMDKRYKTFAKYGVRDIKGYNEKAKASKNTDEELDGMPKIVVIVDELADLMMVASKEVEESICRLAQLARAAGIHLIIATQRPSADVITGLIKTNLPSRIAFRVASSIDSRIILEVSGAERLLGKGDMLFYPQGYSKPLRVQGAYVSDEEVTSVVDYLKKDAACNPYDETIEKVINSTALGVDSNGVEGEGNSGEDLDPYFAEACRLIVSKEKASSGMLQRVYKIGFNRAARMIDQMEHLGIVGPEEGTKPRKVIIDAIGLEEILKNI